jgi:hypothetical protein
MQWWVGSRRGLASSWSDLDGRCFEGRRVSTASCDDKTIEHGRMASHNRFSGRRLRTFTGRAVAATSSDGAAMG